MLSKNGIDTVFACSPPPQEAKESLLSFALEKGVKPVINFKINKHFNLKSNLDDYPKLVRFMNENEFTIVHTHLTNGHLLGGLAARSAFPRPVVVRTCYDSDGGGLRDRFIYRWLTDGIIAVAEVTRRAILDKCPIPPEKIRHIPAAIDTSRFHPENGVRDNRSQWGIEPTAPVVGIVARVQKRRRFHVFFQAIAKTLQKVPHLRVMIIGRGTNIDTVAIDPVKKMGLERHVIFTGYRKDDYVETLNCLDMKVLLVPGSDESCRAAREVMALGKPVIVSKRGMLPEIVEHLQNGLVIDDGPEELADAIMQLVEDISLRRRLGQGALRKAQNHFALEQQFPRIVEFYETLIPRKAD